MLGGENILPELENVLASHPDIAEVCGHRQADEVGRRCDPQSP